MRGQGRRALRVTEPPIMWGKEEQSQAAHLLRTAASCPWSVLWGLSHLRMLPLLSAFGPHAAGKLQEMETCTKRRQHQHPARISSGLANLLCQRETRLHEAKEDVGSFLWIRTCALLFVK
mmetsp:Transcript_56240/g.131056  ORF Transcript_56240/g.131056 Transcript_56240/m.131056 type:complete len:120 (+) Transcript_56240:1023-1382(+)